jgi:predicted GNAT family acetyltransferase
MEIEHQKTGNKGMFFVRGEKGTLAELVYTMPSADKMIIEHTEVSEALKGQSAGYKLVLAAVDYARTNNIKIIPLCPFANSVFKKKPALADVLVK